MQEKSNLVLVGMPASGKSTVGVLLAKTIGYDFVDSDLLIQKHSGQLLSQILDARGVDGFIEVENDVNASIEVEHSVIATGGSAVYGGRGMEHLRENGLVIYLRISYEETESRLSDLHKRGVALRQGQSLRDLYEERTALYEKYADLTVDEDGRTPEETLGDLLQALDWSPEKTR